MEAGPNSSELEVPHESEDVLSGLQHGVPGGRCGTSDALDHGMGNHHRRLGRSPLGLGSRSHHSGYSVGLGVRTGIASQGDSMKKRAPSSTGKRTAFSENYNFMNVQEPGIGSVTPFPKRVIDATAMDYTAIGS